MKPRINKPIRVLINKVPATVPSDWPDLLSAKALVDRVIHGEQYGKDEAARLEGRRDEIRAAIKKAKQSFHEHWLNDDKHWADGVLLDWTKDHALVEIDGRITTLPWNGIYSADERQAA